MTDGRTASFRLLLKAEPLKGSASFLINLN